ncbi:MAG TPA: alpha/beta fold hydrolase [Chloroflexia bacterium]|nr:alpha/beta fold hydrolase [Chloroflexia bacterium]
MNKTATGLLALLCLAVTMLLAACDSGTASPTAPPALTATTAPTLVTAIPTATKGPATATALITPTVIRTPGADESALVDEAHKLIEQLATGDYAGAEEKFDATMSAQLPADKLQAVWEQLVAQFGAFKSQDETQSGQQQAYFIVVIQCTFEKGQLLARVVFSSDGKVTGLFFAPPTTSTPQPTANINYTTPDYVDKSAFTERDISFGDPEWVLTGTLSMPTGAGPHPVVVLVQGSGPSDRDETIDKLRPFRDIAWGLASKGVAVFRYDKRTLVYAAKMATTITSTITVKEEVVDDAVAALDMIGQQDGVDPSRVFLLGHSLGGMLAPMIAQASSSEAGFIVLAGPTRPFEDVILDQYTYIARLDGTVTAQEQTSLDALAKQVQNVKSLTPGSTVTPADLPLDTPASYWLSLQNYSPASVAASLTEPMLILQGESDYQVTMPDFNGWRDALAGHSNATLKTYPGLFHMFMQSRGTPSPRDYAQPGHVDQQVISDLADWITSPRS